MLASLSARLLVVSFTCLDMLTIYVCLSVPLPVRLLNGVQDVELKWTPPMEAELKTFLVDKMGFSEERCALPSVSHASVTPLF